MSTQPSNEPPSPLCNPQRKAYDLLSGLLSAPDLVYSDYTKGFIIRHLVDAVTCGFLLQYKMEPVVNNGSSVILLHAYGDINYEKNYTVPVTICFSQHYPRQRPGVRLNPTEYTIIRHGIHYVDPASGAISHKSLNLWEWQESNVVRFFRQLSQDFFNNPPLGIADLGGVLTHDQVQIKLAKLVFENGGKDFYDGLMRLDRKVRQGIFQEITKKYRRHPDLPTYIKTKEGGIEAFMENVKAVALKNNVRSFSSSSSALGTHGSHQARQMSPLHSAPVPPEKAVLDPQVEKEISNLFVSMSQQQVSYTNPRKELIQKHLRDLHVFYREKHDMKLDLSKHIQIAVRIPYCFQGDSHYFVFVTIILPTDYPDSRPHIRLVCPPDFVISKDLLSVAPSGIIFLSYLRTWDKVKSDLIGLVSHLSAEFTCKAPLVPK